MGKQLGLIVLGLMLSLPAWGQREIGIHWFRDMAEIPSMSPYESLDLGGNLLFAKYDPVMQVGESDIVYLWQPDFAGLNRRLLTRFNLFMEMQWETEIKQEGTENIFYFSTIKDTLLILSVDHLHREDIQEIRATYIEPDSGTIVKTESVARFMGGTEAPVFFMPSPSKEVLLFFQLRRESGNKRVIYYTDYLNNRGDLAFQARRMDEVLYSTYRQDLSLIHSSTIPLTVDKQTFLLDITVDDTANLYLSTFDKPDRLTVEMVNRNNSQRTTLTAVGFPPPETLRYLYDSGFPPYVMSPGEVMVPVAHRINRGRDRGIKSFELQRFDFQAGKVSISHEVKISSGLLVALEKSREEINNRRLRQFDQFVIRDVYRCDSGKVWMIAQFYSHDNFRGMHSTSPTTYQSFEQLIGELVIFVFNKLGEPEQAIIVPSSQSIRNARDRTSVYAKHMYDESRRELRLLLREDSGDTYRGPSRLYLRTVNLNSGQVSPRILIYDPERRTMHTPMVFTQWINSDILHLMSYEGEDERIYGVNVNLAMPPMTEEEREEFQSRR